MIARGRRVGVWAVAGELIGLGDLRLNLGIDRRQLVGAGPALGYQRGVQHLDGVARLPGLDLFDRAVAAIAHAFGVRPGAIRLALDQRWAAATARAPQCLASGLVDRQHVVAIHGHAGYAVAGRALGHVGVARGVGIRHLGGV